MALLEMRLITSINLWILFYLFHKWFCRSHVKTPNLLAQEIFLPHLQIVRKSLKFRSFINQAPKYCVSENPVVPGVKISKFPLPTILSFPCNNTEPARTVSFYMYKPRELHKIALTPSAKRHEKRFLNSTHQWIRFWGISICDETLCVSNIAVKFENRNEFVKNRTTVETDSKKGKPQQMSVVLISNTHYVAKTPESVLPIVKTQIPIPP